MTRGLWEKDRGEKEVTELCRASRTGSYTERNEKHLQGFKKGSVMA